MRETLARLLLLVVLSPTFLLSTPYAKDIGEYWKEIGLDQNYFDRKINVENCITPRNFVACIEAFNVGLKFLDENLIFYPTNSLNKIILSYKIINEFDSLSIILITEPFLFNFSSKMNSFLKLRKEASLEYQELFKQLNRQKTDLLLKKLKLFTEENIFDKHDPAIVIPTMYNGYLTVSVDPHSSIFPKKFLENELLLNAPESNVVGIGTSINKVLGMIILTQVVPNSPAERAGLKPYDVIKSVNGVDVSKLNPKEVAALVVGEEGSEVNIEVFRDGAPLMPFTFVRSPIKRETIISHMIDERVGFIKLKSFFKKGVSFEFKTHLENLISEGMESLILDLRDNPGGLADEGNYIVDLFLEPGKLVFVEERLGNPFNDYWITEDHKIFTGPMVAIINSNSASMSEAMAGTLQDHERSYVVGERSFGKGTSQTYEVYDRPDIIISKSTSKILLPSKRTIDILGVTPDFEVPSDALDPSRIVLREENTNLFVINTNDKSTARNKSYLEKIESIKECMKPPSRVQLADSFPGIHDLPVISSLQVLKCLPATEFQIKYPQAFNCNLPNVVVHAESEIDALPICEGINAARGFLAPFRVDVDEIFVQVDVYEATPIYDGNFNSYTTNGSYFRNSQLVVMPKWDNLQINDFAFDKFPKSRALYIGFVTHEVTHLIFDKIYRMNSFKKIDKSVDEMLAYIVEIATLDKDVQQALLDLWPGLTLETRLGINEFLWEANPNQFGVMAYRFFKTDPTLIEDALLGEVVSSDLYLMPEISAHSRRRYEVGHEEFCFLANLEPSKECEDK